MSKLWETINKIHRKIMNQWINDLNRFILLHWMNQITENHFARHFLPFSSRWKGRSQSSQNPLCWFCFETMWPIITVHSLCSKISRNSLGVIISKPTVNFSFIYVSHLETVNKIGLFFPFLSGCSWDVWGWFWFHYDRISIRKWNGSVERI